jgi:hypothetical protein
MVEAVEVVTFFFPSPVPSITDMLVIDGAERGYEPDADNGGGNDVGWKA